MPNKTSPSFWYHISCKKLPSKIALTPKEIDIISEPSRERICVAPSVAQCLAAIEFSSFKKLYVYRTYRKVKAYYPYRVCDVRITKERWILEPTVFMQIMTFDKHQCQLLSNYSNHRGVSSTIKKQRIEYENICEILLDENIPEAYPNFEIVPMSMIKKIRYSI